METIGRVYIRLGSSGIFAQGEDMERHAHREQASKTQPRVSAFRVKLKR